MTYKNKTDQDLVIPNIGICKAGETIESPIKIENPNFEEVDSQPQQPATPAPVTPAKPAEQTIIEGGAK